MKDNYKKDRNKKSIGFTLAEIIISMTIIGVIAAITIPALLVSTSEKTMKAQKKALQARMSQAMSQIEDMRVYESTATSSALNFVTKALSKVYRIQKTCDKSSLITGCDFPEEIIVPGAATTFRILDYPNISTYIDGPTGSFALDTEVAGFVTANGESIAIFYNPKCYGSKTNGFYGGSAASAMCINMIYDLNSSNEAPNEVGKDVGFISVFFPKDSDVALPVAFNIDSTETFTDYQTAITACKKQNIGLIIPNWEEGMSIALNKRLSNLASSSYLVTGAGSTGQYMMDASTLIPSFNSTDTWESTKLRCVYNE